MGKNKKKSSRSKQDSVIPEELIGAEEQKLMDELKNSALRKVKQRKNRNRNRTSADATNSESNEAEMDEEELAEAEALKEIRAEKSKNENDVKPEIQSRQFINNKTLLQERLDDIKLDSKLPFEETLAYVADKELEIDEVEDDLKREVEFYNQALNAVKVTRSQLEKAGIKNMRPVDYFAEMVKSDKHMGRVKQHLLFEKQKMEGFERRKQQKEFKKYSKQLQAEKQKQKSAQKKKVKELANQYRGKTPDALASLGSSEKNKKRQRSDEPKIQKSSKRLAKDKKYGSGYVKGSKKNSSKSSADMSDFNTKKNKSAFPGMKTKGKKRPGKARRMNRRSG